MWSKTRQILESRLAENLKERISFHFDVYRSNKCKQKPWWKTETPVFSILVDGEPWFCTNPEFYTEKGLWPNQKKSEEVIRETGFVPCSNGCDNELVSAYIHQYLNELSIEQAITHENYFIRLLALLDARLGKRKIKELASNIESEPEWFRKWISLRNAAAILDT